MYQEVGFLWRTSLAMEEVGNKRAAPTLTANEKVQIQKLI